MPVVGHLLYLFSRLYTRASALAERIDVTKSSGDKCGDGAWQPRNARRLSTSEPSDTNAKRSALPSIRSKSQRLLEMMEIWPRKGGMGFFFFFLLFFFLFKILFFFSVRYKSWWKINKQSSVIRQLVLQRYSISAKYEKMSWWNVKYREGGRGRERSIAGAVFSFAYRTVQSPYPTVLK